ncbi:glycerophosphodiester phosphodiesterase [Paenibacillus faecalis]|uniref:glycerophosphodiester phosphodiesterase n=1 Tax=Paenibacillus faecalis TaxID=2079532 RepID=UPI000D0EAFD6|nr:glycerophosphodiester phosphodiesterase family protein [Paenibacillus faecalis]
MKKVSWVRTGLRLIVMVFIILSLWGDSAYALLGKDSINGTLTAMDRKILRIAHRGASGYAPENTMAAFERARALGADMIELDVQLSRDDHAVVIHDTNVNRVSNAKGLVRNMTLEQLQKLDVGLWYDPLFKGEKIPTLEEVLERFGGKMPLLIEMKSPAIYPGIEQKVADLLRKYRLDKPSEEIPEVIVQSFNSVSLQRFHKIMPSVPLAVLVSNPLELTDGRIGEFVQFAQYVNPSLDAANKDNIQKIHKAGMKVFVWNVKHMLDMALLQNSAVDGIITDYPDLL